MFSGTSAAAIDARRILIPETYRTRVGVATTGVPRTPLSLTGLPSEVRQLYPDLRENLELVGCPACHTADADFVHTTLEREFSPFYEKELRARARLLDSWVRGTAPDVPFGPLQDDPVLPE